MWSQRRYEIKEEHEMSSENESGGCLNNIIGLIMIGIVIWFGLLLLPYILGFVGVVIAIVAIFWFFSSIDPTVSPPKKDSTREASPRQRITNNTASKTTKSSATEVKQETMPKNKSTIPHEQLERTYSQVFEVIVPLLGDKERYRQGIRDDLQRKRNRVATTEEYIDSLYQNVAYSYEMFTDLKALLEKYYIYRYPKSFEQYEQDFERLDIGIRANINHLANIQRQLYEQKFETKEEIIDQLCFDYAYWVTVKRLLNHFIIFMITESPKTGELFMAADFLTSVWMIEKYARFQTNSLIGNLGGTVSPKTPKELNQPEISLRKVQKQFNVAGVTHRTDTVYNAVNYLASITPGFQEYKGYSFERIRTNQLTIPKYKDLVSNDFQLIPDSENEYDSHAIKVMIGNKYHIGYVPRERNQEIVDYLAKPNRYSYSGTVEVVGGPARKYDFSKGRVITDSSFNIGFKINLEIVERL